MPSGGGLSDQRASGLLPQYGCQRFGCPFGPVVDQDGHGEAPEALGARAGNRIASPVEESLGSVREEAGGFAGSRKGVARSKPEVQDQTGGVGVPSLVIQSGPKCRGQSQVYSAHAEVQNASVESLLPGDQILGWTVCGSDGRDSLHRSCTETLDQRLRGLGLELRRAQVEVSSKNLDQLRQARRRGRRIALESW